MLSHGNGPQVGLLALQSAAYGAVEPYPLDVLGAETEGMVGYMIEQELGNLLPFEVPLATILTMVEVDPADPAFRDPTKFIGPVYEQAEADRLAAEKGWDFKLDGAKWRRVVPSPLPKRIFEIRPIEWLLEQGTIVICAGGGGIPTMYAPDGTRTLTGAEVRHRQGPRQRPPGAAAGGRPVRHGDRRRRGLPRLGATDAAAAAPDDAGRAGRLPVRVREHGAEGRGRLRLRRHHRPARRDRGAARHRAHRGRRGRHDRRARSAA